ncbi:hypothetical protein [Actinomadura coerulea]|uniref:hypothetical protein n=1 Tax=Actinomadura coerulea TaxID=46159 RepID=UPI00342E5EDE
MSLDVVGAVCIAIGLVGGGLQIGGLLNVPTLSKVKVIALVTIGAVFIATSVAQHLIAPAEGGRADQVQAE